jgi:protoporphyrinogen/coproporphyrinogen III oxidase
MFAEMEKNHRSLVLGMMKRKKSQPAPASNTPRPSIFTTLSGGLQQLPSAIAAHLNPQNIRINTSVQSLAAEGDHYTITLADGSHLQASNVIFTTPAYITADIVQPLDPALAEKLRRIRYVSTSTVSLAFRRSDITCPLNGFGFIVPATEGRRITACSWSSNKFSHRAPADTVLMRVFIGGAFTEPLAEQDDATLIEIARQELQQIMGITATPILTRAYRWKKSNPQYNVGHSALVDDIDQTLQTHPGLHVAGAAYRGSGIPDCIQSGINAATKISST